MTFDKKPQVKRSKIDLFAIPSYVYQGMLARGITLAKLDEVISKEEIKLDISTTGSNPKLTFESIVNDSETYKYLISHLSKIDVRDMLIATKEFHNIINFRPDIKLKNLVDSYVSSSLASSLNGEYYRTSALELYNNLSDLTINMRIEDNKIPESIFKVEVVNNHVYVLISKGFFNFKLFNVPDFHVLVLKSLLFNLFKFFSPEQIQQSDLFQDAVSLFYK